MKLVLVEWTDPCTYHGHGWMDRDERDCNKLKPVSCITVGVLYQDNDERVVVILNLNEDSYGEAQSIPKSCIKRIRNLKVSNE